MNLARLNHVLIPPTFGGREQLRRSRWAALGRPLVFLYSRSTPRGRALLVLSVLTGGVALDVENTQMYLVFALLAGLCTAALLRTRPYAMSGVTIDVTCPRRVAVGEVQHFSVSMTNRSAAAYHAVMVEGAFLPWDGRWQAEPDLVGKLAPNAATTVSCAARFRSRGEHHLDPFTAAALLPLGLSCGPSISSNAARFLVVPPIAPVARVTLPFARRYQPGGVPQASRTGDSMDLLGVRPYRPGDPVRDLHARSWARLGTPVVREYQEEYFSRVGIVLDTDPAHAEPRRFEAALALAAGITARMTTGEALIDLLVVGDQVHALTLGRSLGFLDQALDLLACVTPSRAFEPETLALSLAPFLARLSGLVFVALAWDARRARFVEALRTQGIACQPIVVEGPRARAGTGPRGHLVVSVEAIERREPLSL